MIYDNITKAVFLRRPNRIISEVEIGGHKEIAHVKNCDLELRKKLFELGAGDCIDEDTYKDTNKDPWKRFILKLKELIDKEEQ